MKKVILMAGLFISLGLCTMAQTTPAQAKKETKKEAHQKSDTTSHKVSHEKKGGKKMRKG